MGTQYCKWGSHEGQERKKEDFQDANGHKSCWKCEFLLEFLLSLEKLCYAKSMHPRRNFRKCSKGPKCGKILTVVWKKEASLHFLKCSLEVCQLSVSQLQMWGLGVLGNELADRHTLRADRRVSETGKTRGTAFCTLPLKKQRRRKRDDITR
ncbi:eva-1 homolog Ba isoform X3 [Dunckerocampus dactyliophorus]|uniref:eva-1 homolog Ba isoform X3 n=1 Tax=Dunckerocampus dactyliophorus TaxID=161453 RepID=UPI002404FB15|nr:eva-1 homolog Ba isoform X3 [Dunckerocampus dactyliophorus]